MDIMDHSKIISHKGIKVLSLFFIDKVANYRGYSIDGVPVQGKFALWFEEEFTQQLRKPKYRILYPSVWDENGDKFTINEQALKELASSVHNGYFAQDKKKMHLAIHYLQSQSYQLKVKVVKRLLMSLLIT